MHRFSGMLMTAAVISVLAVTGNAQAATATAQLPTPQQALEVFRDRWGPADFQLKGTSSWQSHSVWNRTGIGYAFQPGTNEFNAEPEAGEGGKPLRLEIFQRESAGRTQYQVVESVVEADGTTTVNYFPVFRGTPESMVFYNSVGEHQTAALEFEETCRDFVKAGRHFQLCRGIRQDGLVAYHTKTRQGEPTENMPTQEQVLGAFRDQWGRASLTPTGFSGWLPDLAWRAEQGLVFDEGENELTDEPTPVAPGRPGVENLDWAFQRRTATGRPDEYQVVHVIDGGAAIAYFPPFFRGTSRGAVFQFENPQTFPDPRTNVREETRILRLGGEEFLIIRVVHAGGGLNYWITRRVR